MMTSYDLPRVLILLTPGFDYEVVEASLERMRCEDVEIFYVGLSKEPICGEGGIEIAPDLSLSDVLKFERCDLMLIPDSLYNNSHLMTEPRIHRLIQQVMEHDGLVATMPDAAAALNRVGLPTPSDRGQFKVRDRHAFLQCIDQAVQLFCNPYSVVNAT